MARVLLLLGGNLGKMKLRLHAAQRLINARIGAVMRCSHRYESDAWGFESADRFSNQAVEVTTDLTPEEILDEIHSIEHELGRDRKEEARIKATTGARYTSRTIDIDIMFYGDEVIHTDRLDIPHPRMAEREFALVPLVEIARDKRHPESGRTLKEMLNELKTKK